MTLMLMLGTYIQACQSCVCVYISPCVVEHNEYVQTVMRDSTYLLLDETKVKQLLSVGNDSGCLLEVIKHIVSS